MKYKKQVLCGLMLCFCLCMTGCGKLYVMTDDEENQVVLYAAKMVSKYNRAQDTGYSYVSDEHKDKQKDTDVGQSDDASVDETQQEKTQMTLSDVIGISGISFSYQGYDISSSYETTDVAIPGCGRGLFLSDLTCAGGKYDRSGCDGRSDQPAGHLSGQDQ